MNTDPYTFVYFKMFDRQLDKHLDLQFYYK